MEKHQFITNLVNNYGWASKSATILAKIVEEKEGFDNFDWNKVKNYKVGNGFVCEICHCLTPLKCEGSEPNACAMCMPIKVEKDKVDDYEWN